jgi:hypothetical protein
MKNPSLKALDIRVSADLKPSQTNHSGHFCVFDCITGLENLSRFEFVKERMQT